MRISDWSSDVCSSDLGPFVDRLVDPLDDLPFVVGLVETDRAPAGAVAAQGLDLGQCRRAVDLRLALAQPVQVGSVENEDRLGGHGRLLSLRSALLADQARKPRPAVWKEGEPRGRGETCPENWQQ